MPDPDPRLSPEAKADIQGFITSAYGHLAHAAYLSLGITDPGMGKEWLREIVPLVTSAKSWRTASGKGKQKPKQTLNVGLTFAGLRQLGLSEEALCSFPDEYREGMAEAQRSRILGDVAESSPRRWELGGPENPPIHVFLVLHGGSAEEIDAMLARERERLANNGGVVEIEGSLQRGHWGGKEPFGFRDGIGQPKILGIKGEGVPSGEFILGYKNHYNIVPMSPVVPLDDDPDDILPASANPYQQEARWKDLGKNGSFLVYRKLAQDVAGFWRFLREESARRDGRPDPRHMVWLASKMVGRWPSGTSLVVAPERDDPSVADKDDFLYRKEDPKGLRCPFGSHVRRTNPRDMIRPTERKESLSITEAHRILRRATLFGEPLFDLSILDAPSDAEKLRGLLEIEAAGGPRGIHFLGVNASIKGQFEHIQQTWCNSPQFNALSDNKDPLVGDNDPGAREPSRMSIPGCPVRTAPLPRFVTVLGGAYFFLPSLMALRYLAGAKP